MPIRITGMNSGLDTESIISELVKAKSAKKDKLVKAQTKLQWKQDAWKELNKKVYSFYSKSLSNMRFSSDYLKKTTKVSNSSAASVITGATAVNGVQSLEIEELATTGYLTGTELKDGTKKASYNANTKLSELEITEASELRLSVDGKSTNIAIDGNMTIGSFVSKLKEAGVNASFDEKNQRFFISSKESGKEADFSLIAKDDKGRDALKKLGLETAEEYKAYCNYDKNTNTYTAKSAEELKSVIDGEVSSRLAKYISDIKARDELQKKIDEINAKYTDGGLETLDTLTTSQTTLEGDLKAKKEELESATDEAEKTRLNGEIESLNRQIEEVKTKITDRKELDKSIEERDALNSSIVAESNNFTGNATDGYEATDVLKSSITSKVLGEAAFAEEVLNNPASTSSGAHRVVGMDARISLNGAIFESETNTFEINGLTITANAKTTEPVSITTSDDVDGIYDMVKDFLKEYNELINEMDKLYNAESAKGYEPLTDEEKEALSEKEVEKWEEKIKNSILRKDSTLSSVAGEMKSIMSQGVTLSDGTKLYLSDFGINTLGYFNAPDNEKNAYHIDGDPDDSNTSGNGDKLKTAIANNSQQVIDFFTTLSESLYKKVGDMMKKTAYSSSFTLYDDVAMKEEYDDYTSKIKTQEQKITDFEDRYYKKFSAMETALAKMSSKESAISGLLGM